MAECFPTEVDSGDLLHQAFSSDGKCRPFFSCRFAELRLKEGRAFLLFFLILLSFLAAVPLGKVPFSLMAFRKLGFGK